MIYKNKIQTDKSGMFNITDTVLKNVEDSQIKDGLVCVYTPHSTSGITIFSPMDDLGYEDMDDELDRLVPTRTNFKHEFDTPSDAAGHIKSAIIGVSSTIILSEGKVQLGGSQGIFFYEFDGPRNREFYVKIA